MKDEYSLLNNVEVDFSQYTIEEVSDFEKKRMMKKFIDSKNKKAIWNKRKIIAAAAALFLVVNIGLNANKVLVMATSLKYNIGTWLGIDNSGEKYETQLGKTFEGKETKLALNEFFMDNSRIVINLNVNRDINDTVKDYRKLIPDIYIDGKKVKRSSNYAGYRVGEVDGNAKESNIILEIEGKDLPSSDKENVKLIFSNLAKECNVGVSDFTYSFVYDSTNYKNASKEIKVDKSIVIGENKLSVDNVTVTPDRVLISGSSKGFSAFENTKNVYYYDIVDQNGDSVPLKEEIGEGAYFYRFVSKDIETKNTLKSVSTLKIIPYTFNKINTNTTSVLSDGRTKYIMEDKIITIDLKNKIDTNTLMVK